MKQTKLRRIHVVIIGIVVCAIIGAGMFFVMIKKSNEAMKAEQARLDQFAPTGTPSNVKAAEKDRDAARIEVADAQNTLDKYMRAKMPYLNFSDPPGADPGTGRATGMLALYTEETQNLAPLLYRFAGRTPGVAVLSEITIPAPPFNPNDPMFAQDVITLAVGKMKVRGSYKAIMNHIRSWSACGRLVDINAPSFTGTSPKLECEYDMTVYLMPKFKADTTKPLGIASAAAATP